ncbi:MAG: cobalt ABC transporter [Treponema sp.]|nr:MAG: cobalt ABC transporter [Treponema sp.]
MIKLDDIEFTYENKDEKSLTLPSFEVEKGECVLLTGLSGSGKSTITKCINGLIPEFFEGEFSGSAIVNGSCIDEMPVYDISRFVGSVFQDPASQFFTESTVSELAFACENYGIAEEEIKRRINKAVQTVHVEKLVGKKLSELSNGEKQKMAITSVLTMEPTVLLLDEPSSNLDYASILHLKHIIQNLKEKGFTIIIAEHRIYYLQDIFDRVVYVKDGKVEHDYTAEEFKALNNDTLHEKGLRSLDIFLNKPTRKVIENPKTVVECKNLKYSYKSDKENPVLKDINLKLHSGEITALVGRNGIGKTTLARVLAGIYKEESGEVLLRDKKVPAKKRVSEINFVMNNVDYQLFGDSVYNELVIGNKHIENLDEKITAVLKQMNLYEFKDEHPSSLSMGQKQRLVISASYIKNSPITILDEPTSGLDYRNMLNVSKLLSDLAECTCSNYSNCKDNQSEKNAILIISHDYEFIANTCERLLLLTENGISKDIKLTGNNDDNENNDELKSIFLNELGGF